MRRYRILFFNVILAVCLSGVALAQKPDLSGVWKLNQDKSFSNGPGFDQVMTVTHAGDKFKLEAKQKTARGETTINEDYILDGTEAEFVPQGMPPNSKGQRTATWLPNGRGILVVDVINNNEGKLMRQVTRKMALSSDGKTLTVDIYIDDPQRGPFELKRVYDKTG